MSLAKIYIIVALVAALIAVVLVFLAGGNSKDKRLTPMAALAFGFILAGIFFGNNLYVGYSLIAIGLILSFTDMYMKFKKKG
ncbi:MAG: hypothetical protein H6Q58_620 [Firmicutes bacterium]|nr:hypothetical protein [Bacillota bacterium]